MKITAIVSSPAEFIAGPFGSKNSYGQWVLYFGSDAEYEAFVSRVKKYGAYLEISRQEIKL